MRVSTLTIRALILLPSLAFATLPKFRHLVTFGDSYTDTETVLDGGIPWPIYLAGYAKLKLHPFARAGATCSDKVTTLGYPSVMESQLPAFLRAGGPVLLPQDRTVYTLWIGTNDVGGGALLTGNFPGKTVVDTTKCAVSWVKALYALGARYFVFQNMIPLELTPIYAVDAYPTVLWNPPRNTTAHHNDILQLTMATNALSELLLRDLAPKLPGAHISYFNSHGLFADMYHKPHLYLNGTAPLNVTGAASACVYELNGGPVGGKCPPPVSGTDRDSYLWWDELHPGEQADRIVAREIAKALAHGNTKWATWIS